MWHRVKCLSDAIGLSVQHKPLLRSEQQKAWTWRPSESGSPMWLQREQLQETRLTSQSCRVSGKTHSMSFSALPSSLQTLVSVASAQDVHAFRHSLPAGTLAEAVYSLQMQVAPVLWGRPPRWLWPVWSLASDGTARPRVSSWPSSTWTWASSSSPASSQSDGRATASLYSDIQYSPTVIRNSV